MVTYQGMLQDEFHKRRGKNKSYSLSAFARDLNISQPFLFQVIEKKRRLSDEKALLISHKIGWKSKQKTLFVNLVRLETTRDQQARQLLQREIQDVMKKSIELFEMREDVFNIASDWYYYALLELTTIKGFKSDKHWISKKLGVPEIDIAAAIHRLKRMNLLKEEDGVLKKVKDDYSFRDVPSEALKKHHRQSMELAKAALDQELGVREFVSVTMAMDPQQIKVAKEKIHEFCIELMENMEKTERKSVYKLSLQMFRLDKVNV